VQHDDEREYYELERLWKDCPALDLGVVGTEQGGR
jgi:ribosome-associated protein